MDTLCQLTKIGFQCHVLHIRLYPVLFLATNASCVLTSFSRQWTTSVRGHHIAHIVYVPLCFCVSPRALVFLCHCTWLSLCLCFCFSVLVSSIWFPFPALLSLVFILLPCIFRFDQKIIVGLFFKMKPFNGKKSITLFEECGRNELHWQKVVMCFFDQQNVLSQTQASQAHSPPPSRIVKS